jgi:hypothetical protein
MKSLTCECEQHHYKQCGKIMENPLNNGGISDSQFMDDVDDDR